MNVGENNRRFRRRKIERVRLRLYRSPRRVLPRTLLYIKGPVELVITREQMLHSQPVLEKLERLAKLTELGKKRV